MATRKTAQKTSKKVGMMALQDLKVSKSTKNNMQKAVKGTSFKVLVFAVVFLIVGIAVGGGVWWGLCRNDCFEILGQDEIVLTLNETYTDEGVKIVAFGKDESENITLETNLKKDLEGNFYSQEVGTFYITYTSNSFKYGRLFKIQKVRLITFVEASEGGE